MPPFTGGKQLYWIVLEKQRVRGNLMDDHQYRIKLNRHYYLLNLVPHSLLCSFIVVFDSAVGDYDKECGMNGEYSKEKLQL